MEVTYDAKEVLEQYRLIADAVQFVDERGPLIEEVLAHRGDERISVQSMGEAIMGKEKYHETLSAYSRSVEAVSLTATLTQIFRKMCKAGILTRHEERSKEPIVIETEGWAYFDMNGNAIPDKVEIRLTDGSTLELRAEEIRNTVYRWGTMNKLVHPKVVYYTFN